LSSCRAITIRCTSDGRGVVGLLGWSWTSKPLRWLAGPDQGGTDAARRRLADVEPLDDCHLEHRLIRTPPGAGCVTVKDRRVLLLWRPHPHGEITRSVAHYQPLRSFPAMTMRWIWLVPRRSGLAFINVWMVIGGVANAVTTSLARSNYFGSVR
jgi:hypothetical protein